MQERLRTTLRNLEVSERRISHFKCQLASIVQSSSVQHWPGDSSGPEICHDVEHAMGRAELSTLQHELQQEVSNLLFYRRATELQRMASKLLLSTLSNRGREMSSEEVRYKRRMVDFRSPRCNIAPQAAGDIEAGSAGICSPPFPLAYSWIIASSDRDAL